jgi:hypothetical protein
MIPPVEEEVPTTLPTTLPSAECVVEETPKPSEAPVVPVCEPTKAPEEGDHNQPTECPTWAPGTKIVSTEVTVDLHGISAAEVNGNVMVQLCIRYAAWLAVQKVPLSQIKFVSAGEHDDRRRLNEEGDAAAVVLGIEAALSDFGDKSPEDVYKLIKDAIKAALASGKLDDYLQQAAAQFGVADEMFGVVPDDVSFTPFEVSTVGGGSSNDDHDDGSAVSSSSSSSGSGEKDNTVMIAVVVTVGGVGVLAAMLSGYFYYSETSKGNANKAKEAAAAEAAAASSSSQSVAAVHDSAEV